MTALIDLEVEVSIMLFFTVLLVFSMTAFYGVAKEREINPILVGALTVAAMLGIVIIYKFLYLDKEKRLLNQFKSGYEVICITKDKKILVSKNRGYILKSKYFIKDGVALEYKNCSDMGDTKTQKVKKEIQSENK